MNFSSTSLFVDGKQPRNKLLNDPSLWFLFLSNCVTIFFAIKGNWNLLNMMWIYWFQSITIGLFNFLRILQLKEFSTTGFKINGLIAKSTQGTKLFTAFFFLFHYGFFHFGYFVFLLIETFMHIGSREANFIGAVYILLIALLFFLNHLFSYFYNRPKDTAKQNIGSLMFYPYARIMPMHLTIIIGTIFDIALPIFLVLKTFADIIMHIIEHHVIRKREAQ